MNRLMHEVFAVIVARGNVTPEDVEAFIAASDGHDPVALYEDYIVAPVNLIENEILEARR